LNDDFPVLVLYSLLRTLLAKQLPFYQSSKATERIDSLSKSKFLNNELKSIFKKAIFSQPQGS
jgi:hypothetical protein